MTEIVLSLLLCHPNYSSTQESQIEIALRAKKSQK